MKAILEKAYDKGFVDGLSCYAHWSSGQQFVGTVGTSLESAIKDRAKAWNYNTDWIREFNLESS